MKLKELLTSLDDSSILRRLFKLYPDQRPSVVGYEQALKELRSYKRLRKTNIKIIIEIAKSLVDDEDYVDVSGINPDDPDTRMAIEYCLWSEWLNMEIKTVREFDTLDIMAHCLWEMTWAGYSSKQVRRSFKRISKIGDEIMKDMADKEVPVAESEDAAA